MCELRVMNDANYPWLILVPRREHIREIHELPENDQRELTSEISMVSKALQEMTGAIKMNVAALGNMVPQLHVHVIARFENDPAWPGPIWGVVDTLPYSQKPLAKFVQNLERALEDIE